MIKGKWLLFPALILTLFLAAACSSSDSNDTDGDEGSTDGDTDDGTDGDTDDGTDGDVDSTEDGDVEKEGSGVDCLFYSDCEDHEDCVEGACVWSKNCFGNEDCSGAQICHYISRDDDRGVCRKVCNTDMNCPDEGQCMNGICEPYEPIAEGTPPPKHPEWNGKLHASYAEDELTVPMTTTMGGYGARKGPVGPYQRSMGASTGILARMMIKVFVLDNGTSRAVFVRIPMIFPTDFMVSGVVKRVNEMGGPDLRENIIMTATHTHSGPGSFWYLLPHLSFGALGFADFEYEIYDYIVTSIAKAVYEANKEENFRKAAFGYKIWKDFDPDDLINRDRRGENDDYKDPLMMVMRVDDLSGDTAKPWILAMRFALHGTIQDYDDTTMSNDSAGGAEIMTEFLYEKEHPGEDVHAMFFNGNAGDVSPGGDRLSHRSSAQMQMLGTNVHAKAWDLWGQIETTDELDIQVASKRIPIDRDYIGYTDEEFTTDGTSPGEFPPARPIRFGAFQCSLMRNIVEENLDMYVYGPNGDLIGKSTKQRSSNEVLAFTPEANGTYYIKVEGFDGCINNYDAMISENGRGGDKSHCVDAECGQSCGMCSGDRAMVPRECVEDAYEDNDTMESATNIDLNTNYENLQVCAFDEDWFAFDLVGGTSYKAEIVFDQNDTAYNDKTMLKEGNFGCALHIDAMNFGPLPQFGKTRLTAIVLGKLYLAGLPGEALSHMGTDTAEELMADTTVSDAFDDVVIFGYTNDHHFYISSEYDWLQGGYETTMSIWGPKFGAFLTEHLKALAIALAKGEEETSINEFPKVKPTNFNGIAVDPRVPEVTPAPTDTPPAFDPAVANPPQILTQPADTVKMEQQAMIRWVGGDPGAEVPLPHVYLERKEGDAFVPVTRSTGEVYDDSYYEMRLYFENEHFALPNKPDADPNNYWSAYWEETYSFPAGTYRFRIEGHYYDGPTDQFDKENGVKEYTLTTDAFELLPTTFQLQETSFLDGQFSASVRYARPYSNDTGDNEFEGIESRAYLLHDPTCEPYIGPMAHANSDTTTVTLEIYGSDLGQPTVIDQVTWSEDTGAVYYVNARDAEGNETLVAGSRGNRPRAIVTADLPDDLAPDEYTIVVTVTDIWDNTGSFTFDYSVAAPE